MKTEAARIIGLMKQLAPDDHVDKNDHLRVHVYQTRYMAQLMVVVTEEQEEVSLQSSTANDMDYFPNLRSGRAHGGLASFHCTPV
jgi:hypothetical protein